MSDDTTASVPAVNRGHLHAARVGHETARAFLTHLGGEPVDDPPWRRLDAAERYRHAESLARFLGESGLLASMRVDRRIRMLAGSEAYRAIEARSDVDHTTPLEVPAS